MGLGGDILGDMRMTVLCVPIRPGIVNINVPISHSHEKPVPVQGQET